MLKMVGLLCGVLALGAGWVDRVSAEVGPKPILNITPQLYVLEPGTCPDDIEAVSASDRAAQFKQVGSPDVHFGYTKDAYWFRLEMGGLESTEALTLELNNPQLLSVTLYTPSPSGGYHGESVGVTKPFWERPLVTLAPSFPVEMVGAEGAEVYLRIQHYGALRFRAYLGPADAMREQAITWIALNILLAGSLLGLTIYHGCIFVGLRQEVYLWLSLFLFSITLNQMTFSGTANMLLWNEPSVWANHALTLTGIFCLAMGMCFSMCYLRSWKFAPGTSRLATGVIALGTIAGLLSFAGYPAVLYGVLAYVVIAPVLLVVMAVHSVRRGTVGVYLFLLSWGFVMVGEIVFASVYLDIVPDNAFTMNFMHVASLAAALIWSFSLTRQIRIRAAQQRAQLEREVGERTADLERALKDVKTLQGFLPVCSNCKMIRDDDGAWHSMESYVMANTEASFSHGICPGCATELYPKYFPPEGKQ